MRSERIFWHGSKRMETEPISCVIRDRGSETRRRTNYCSNSNDNGFIIHHTLHEQIMRRTIFFKGIKAQKELSAVYYINKAYIQWCEENQRALMATENMMIFGGVKKSHLGDGESAFDSLINFAES